MKIKVVKMLKVTFAHKWVDINLIGKDRKDLEKQLTALGCPHTEIQNILKEIVKIKIIEE